jgi:serine O-acetyltransferase
MINLIENSILEIVSDILIDYDEGKSIDKITIFSQLDSDAISNIVQNIQKILLPGYFRNRKYKIYTVRNQLTMLVEDVIYNLQKQIVIALRYDDSYANETEDSINRIADEITVKFIKQIPKIREYFETDLHAAYDGDPAAYSLEEIVFAYPGLYAIMINRIAHELYKLKVPLIPRIMTELAHSSTGIDIHPGATIGKYFFIDHGTGIVIGETTIIGENVKIYQGVTLGALSLRGGQKLKSVKRHPTIEDNVTIYSGASILGGDTVIGRDAIIGGNTFITKSIEAGTRVSIKNQELQFSYDSKKKAELKQEDFWDYII